jgi:hypothetical protein
MRIEILANDRASFIQPMAEGLQRMLRDCGAEATVHYDGLSHLMRSQSIHYSTPRRLIGSTTRLQVIEERSAHSWSDYEQYGHRRRRGFE